MFRTWSASFLEALRARGDLTGAGQTYALALPNAEDWLAVATFLRSEGAVDMLVLITATHLPPYYFLRYDLRSLPYLADIAVSFYVPEHVGVPSVAKVWPAALWQEREAYDLTGVQFIGHPDLRRILLPEDWCGHPLRKDYIFPEDYHDIPLTFIPPSLE